ncbi:hypothetical protein ACFPM3_12170 [Streptomyces coeruleoprunus]|uniref:Uncharacterized protein n=1 Tax=Streptomyces coeruleoprunus TaxID=285563 RepID=A0ABV9XDA6_9ACTN
MKRILAAAGTAATAAAALSGLATATPAAAVAPGPLDGAGQLVGATSGMGVQGATTYATGMAQVVRGMQ